MTWLLWIKALHVIAVIAWMAGLLYLPRLFVYHAGAAPGSELSETLKVMERRLLRAIMNPAMIAAWGFGLLLMWQTEAWRHPWFHLKLVAIIALTVLHHVYAAWRKTFERDGNRRDARFYRIANEVPTLFLTLAVVAVVVKPF